MNQAQQAAIELLRSRLDPKHPMFTATKEIAAALGSQDVRCYFDTWVIPLVEFLRDGPAYYGQADEIKRDLSNRKAAAETKARWEAQP
jgi:hypothetical protein